MTRPNLDHIESALSGEPQTTPEQEALIWRVKAWAVLKLKRIKRRVLR